MRIKVQPKVAVALESLLTDLVSYINTGVLPSNLEVIYQMGSFMPVHLDRFSARLVMRAFPGNSLVVGALGSSTTSMSAAIHRSYVDGTGDESPDSYGTTTFSTISIPYRYTCELVFSPVLVACNIAGMGTDHLGAVALRRPVPVGAVVSSLQLLTKSTPVPSNTTSCGKAYDALIGSTSLAVRDYPLVVPPIAPAGNLNPTGGLAVSPVPVATMAGFAIDVLEDGVFLIARPTTFEDQYVDQNGRLFRGLGIQGHASLGLLLAEDLS